MGEDAADLLARFPGPVVLYPSRDRYTFLMLGCLIFILLGGANVGLGHPALGWFLIASSGLGFVLFASTLLPGAYAFKLDRAGFEFTIWFRRGKVRWQDAADFTVVAASSTMMVVFNHAGRKVGPLNGVMERALAKGRNALVPDTYGLRAEDLAELLSRWRERAIHTG